VFHISGCKKIKNERKFKKKNMARFIELRSAFGNKTISIDQIASMEPSFGGTKVTLKTIENGTNAIFNCSDNYNGLVALVDRMSRE
jgi:hypothetical protein